MKIRNKKTGEILDVYKGQVLIHFDNGRKTKLIKSLDELKDWEDYEEPKEDGLDNIITLVEAYSNHDSEMYPKEIVDKLKAWQRLKDKGFSFGGWEDCNCEINTIYFSIPENKWETDTCDDLDICFGGEE